MSRIIKFRVWDKDLNIMITFPNHYYESIYFDGKPWNNPNQNPMQFTGLKDKNDKEIYEGDILNVKRFHIYPIIKNDQIDYEFKEGAEEVGQIYFGRCSFLMSFEHIRYDDIIELSECDTAHRLEIIGNIFENPEL